MLFRSWDIDNEIRDKSHIPKLIRADRKFYLEQDPWITCQMPDLHPEENLEKNPDRPHAYLEEIWENAWVKQPDINCLK